MIDRELPRAERLGTHTGVRSLHTLFRTSGHTHTRKKEERLVGKKRANATG